ncbi:MAG TPA: type II toxin-antitoxin system ParD family antitoxin [Alphaproteobacteria bacterium]|nr:type II toxin-antitoxin system ParD family antitoxin [Alphaproteobacteria bacterium]HAJ48749.1 type II toxin-antitoxin system ParD family antitoxin [Alphaproteobacteria bacterium]
MNRLTLSPEQEEWMRARIADGTFADESDYLGDLIRRDRATLLAELKKGEDSGVSFKSVKDIFAEVKRNFLARQDG